MRNEVLELAEAVSTQARVANRFWLALMVAALFVLLPRGSQVSTIDTVGLPFQLGDVPAQAFYAVAFPMLAVLLVASCAAHAQEVRATVLAHRRLDSMAAAASDSELHPRDLFDLHRLPSLSQVAPLAQGARGRYQFYPEAPECPRWLGRVSAAYYLFLKFFAISFYLLLPGWAVLYAAFLAVAVGWPWWFLAMIGAPALVAFGHTLVVEVRYVFRVMGVISRRAAGQQSKTAV